jgi:hypothetical protein
VYKFLSAPRRLTAAIDGVRAMPKFVVSPRPATFTASKDEVQMVDQAGNSHDSNTLERLTKPVGS